MGHLEDMRIRLPNGVEVPFSLAAETDQGYGFASINRTDRKRTINITADVDVSIANANEIIADITTKAMPELLRTYRGITYSLEGEQSEQQETLAGLGEGFLFALLLIYILLAIPFRSYSQPLIVMTAIPFGIVGAVWGHVLMGVNLTILSGFGIVALTGVVVNDSLVMVDFVNREVAGGKPLKDAIRTAGVARFRPILLTSITTFAGLTPLLLERSMQAQFLIPMAISLAFGVIFATSITLILVPSSYHILEDAKQAVANMFTPPAKQAAMAVSGHSEIREES
jgi:multidrug efflux pump subunit AcrB